MDDRCVIFYDSGTGGLNLLKRTATEFTDENFLYYGDFGNMPYGTKSKDEIIDVVKANFEKFLNFAPKLIVVACNTASTVAEEVLNSCSVATIGVYPEVSEKGSTALLCTPATAASGYVCRLKEKYSRLTVYPMPSLAEEIERAVLDGKTPETSDHYEEDNLSLGCTHFSFIYGLPEKIRGGNIISGEERAYNKIRRFLKSTPHRPQKGKICFINGEKDKLQAVYDRINTGL